MQKILTVLVLLVITPLAIADNNDWVETKQDSHIFIKKDNIAVDQQNPNLKTTQISINIPAMHERKADPTKTVLTNPYPISYITDFTINCQDKTAKIGKQAIHEKFFGEGNLLEESPADPNAKFIPINSADAKKILEVVCPPSDQ